MKLHISLNYRIYNYIKFKNIKETNILLLLYYKYVIFNIM